MGITFMFFLETVTYPFKWFYYRYAVVRKEPPPRPPAPVRKRGSTKGERQFATMPHLRKDEDAQQDNAELPERPIRNYSTIGPTRPPRRASIVSLGETDK